MSIKKHALPKILREMQHINFNTSYVDGSVEGRLQWNTDDGHLEYGLPGGNVNLPIGKTNVIKIKNSEASDLVIGDVVYAYPTPIGKKTVKLSTASDHSIAITTVGVVLETIAPNQFGYIASMGVVAGFDTSALNYGEIAYLSETPGKLIATPPEAPNTAVEVGIVIHVHATEGAIFVRIDNRQYLEELSDVHLTSLIDNNITRWDETNSRWINSTAPTSEEWKANGFVTRTNSTLTWTDTSPDRTLSIQPTSSPYDYYVEGIKYTSTGDTLQITDVEGIHAIYYDGDTLTETVNPSSADIRMIIVSKALVCIMYWNATDKEAIYVGEERHGKVMSPSSHSYHHFLDGLRYLSPGLGLNTMSVDGDGSSDTHAQFGIDSGDVADEDLHISIDAVLPTTGLPIYYMLGSSPRWVKDDANGFACRTYDKTTATRLAYNEYTGGSWQLTEESGGDFVLMHIFATTEKDNPMISIMGQNGYATKRAARAGALIEIHSLVLDEVLFPEIRPIATIIYQTKTAYTNSINARIVSTEEGDDYIDWRDTTIARSSISTSDHGSLTGLGNDDHTQYLLADGSRSMTGTFTTSGAIISTANLISLGDDARSEDSSIQFKGLNNDGEIKWDESVGEFVFDSDVNLDVSDLKWQQHSIGPGGSNQLDITYDGILRVTDGTDYFDFQGNTITPSTGKLTISGDLETIDLEASSEVISPIVTTSGTTDEFKIKPDATGSGVGVSLFEDSGKLTGNNPLLRLRGYASSLSSDQQKYVDIGLDTWGRLKWDGNFRLLYITKGVQIGALPTASLLIGGYSNQLGTNTQGTVNHPIYSTDLQTYQAPIHVYTEFDRTNSNFAVPSTRYAQIWLHDGTATLTNLMKMYHNGTRGVIDAAGYLSIPTSAKIGDGGTTDYISISSAGVQTFNGAAKFQLPNVTDAGPMTATNGTESEVVYNTSDNKSYVCTATGTPATWAALN